MKGIDYGYGRPGAKTIKDAGYEFVCRYLSHSPAKNITADELKELQDQGLAVVFVWETTEQRPLAGFVAGKADALAAQQQLKDLGIDDSVLYFAADYDFSADQQDTINDYFKGAAAVFGKDRIGVYGGYNVVKGCFDAGVVGYGWQTYAWSHGKWDDRAQLRQINIYGPTLNGVPCDTDESVADDFGQVDYDR